MEIKQGQLVLLVRYSSIFQKDPIEDHINILKKNGYVWYGKYGASPSRKTIDQIKDSGFYYVILYSPKLGSYLAKIDLIQKIKPENGMPDYYGDYCYAFSLYFRIIQLVKLNPNFYTSFVTDSSNEPASFSINQSMSGMFILRKETNIEDI